MISGCHGGGYEQFYLLDVSEEHEASIFRIEEKAGQKSSCVHAGILLGLHFDPENGRDMFFRNVG
jgi:hypothetical protein